MKRPEAYRQEGWTPISTLPRAYKPRLTPFGKVLLGQFFKSIMMYAKNTSMRHGISSATDFDQAQDKPEYSRLNQEAVAKLVALNYLRINLQQDLSLADGVLHCRMLLTDFSHQHAPDIAFKASGQFISGTNDKDLVYTFTVTFASESDQKQFIEMLNSFDIDSTNDLAFTDSLALYMNIQFPKILAEEKCLQDLGYSLL